VRRCHDERRFRGIFVATARLLRAGDQVTVSLNAEGDAPPLEALAEVRWCRPFEELARQPTGVGLRFIDTPLRAALLTNELRRTLGPSPSAR
jgi:Tfp pilus assembly protein PilZ